jgi:acyl-CoA thioester hydrolase
VSEEASSGPFRHRIRVRYNECDPQGIVFNGNYLTYFDVAITELWRSAGGYETMMAAGTDLVVAEARVRYLAPLRFDEEFEVAVTVTRLGETSMSTDFRLERGGEPVAEGELRHVFVNTDGGATAAIPDRVREGLLPYAVAPG